MVMESVPELHPWFLSCYAQDITLCRVRFHLPLLPFLQPLQIFLKFFSHPLPLQVGTRLCHLQTDGLGSAWCTVAWHLWRSERGSALRPVPVGLHYWQALTPMLLHQQQPSVIYKTGRILFSFWCVGQCQPSLVCKWGGCVILYRKPYWNPSRLCHTASYPVQPSKHLM